MLKFNEQKQIDSVNGALALRGQINDLVDGICKEGYKNICWLGIGGTYASCLQAEVHMKEKSELPFFVENAAEYLTTGNKKVGEGTIVIISSVTGSTSEIVEGVKKAQAAGAKVIGFIDVATAELAKLVDHVITYPANEQLKFYMVADRFMYNAGEFPEYDDLYSELDQHLANLEKNLQIAIKMMRFIILLEQEISMEQLILTQCAIGKNSTGSVQNPFTVQNFSTVC